MRGIDWMQAGPFGVVAHWAGDAAPPAGSPKLGWDERVERFPADACAGALQKAGAKWLIFPVGHSGNFCAPNAEIERLCPGRCSRRDLARDLGLALHKRGMRLIINFQTAADREDEDMRRAFLWDIGPTDKGGFQRIWTCVLEAYAKQWGGAIDGWWFDGCHGASAMCPNTAGLNEMCPNAECPNATGASAECPNAECPNAAGPDAERSNEADPSAAGPDTECPHTAGSNAKCPNAAGLLSERAPAGWDNRRFGDGSAWLAAARAGNPAAVVAMNPGVACLRHEAVLGAGEDYLAGESDTLDVRPVAALQDGRQWHGLVWLDSSRGRADGSGEIAPPRFSDGELFGYLEECHSRGGAATFGVGICGDGMPAEESLLQLARMRGRWEERFGAGAHKRAITATDRLADGIRERLERPINGLLHARPACARADAYRGLVRAEAWTEHWHADGCADGAPAAREVAGEIWSDAIRQALGEANGVFLPARGEPYYLDGPIVLGSGQSLLADDGAEIRLKPGVNTCMVRNRRAASFRDEPAPAPSGPDEGFVIEGGVWTTLAAAHGQFNGNLRGRSDAADSVPGAHGVFFLCNARRFAVRNLTVRQSAPYAVHVCAASDFLIEGISLDDQRRDGVHLQGGTSYGVVRNITGRTGDDFVALNGWEWDHVAPCFGRIDHILAEGIHPSSGGWNTIRMLPGRKALRGGRIADCTVSDIVFRRIRGVEWLYSVNQPNLELGREADSSASLGNLRNIHVEDIEFTQMPANYAAAGSCPVRLHVDTDGFTLRDVRLSAEIADEHALVEIGPLSLAVKVGQHGQERWVEVYSPDLDCTVANLALEDIKVLRGGAWAAAGDPYALVRCVEQTVNGGYPAQKPQGGVGRGIWDAKPPEA